MNIDLHILRALNGFASDHAWAFAIFSAFGNPLLRGAPVFASLAIVSFSDPTPRVKSQILLGLLATFSAVAVSIWCQSHLHVHLRPVFDTALNINDFEKWGAGKDDWGKRVYSFPSDTATAYFAVGTIVFLQRKALGLFCFGWIAVTVGIGRVVLGFHYPTDILAGFLLGFAFVVLSSHLKVAQGFLMRSLHLYDPGSHVYLTLVCLFSAEAYSLFPGSEAIYFALMRLLHSL